MCFSVQIDKDIRRLAALFGARPAVKEFYALKELQDFEQKAGPEEIKKIFGLKRKPNGAFFKTPEEDGRVYPNTFAPAIVLEKGEREKGERTILPMRYRVRPKGSREEIPSKYNVFNARIDSLEKRKTWSSLFGRKHALFPFHSFYEWVEDKEGKKRLINFAPENKETMWAPALWDEWTSADGKIKFSSFALITDDPPPEIEEQGHDRCPVFLSEEYIDVWLSPQNRSKEELYSLLGNKTETNYRFNFP